MITDAESLPITGDVNALVVPTSITASSRLASFGVRQSSFGESTQQPSARGGADASRSGINSLSLNPFGQQTSSRGSSFLRSIGARANETNFQPMQPLDQLNPFGSGNVPGAGTSNEENTSTER